MVKSEQKEDTARKTNYCELLKKYTYVYKVHQYTRAEKNCYILTYTGRHTKTNAHVLDCKWIETYCITYLSNNRTASEETFMGSHRDLHLPRMQLRKRNNPFKLFIIFRHAVVLNNL